MKEDKNAEFPFARSFVCPHCGTKAQFNLIFPDLEDRYRTEAAKNIELASFQEDDYFSYMYTIWCCQVCKRLVFRANKRSKYDDPRVVGQFPSNIRVASNFTDSVPSEILEDFESALKCYEFDEYRPAAAMCRRSLQASLLEQGADPNKKLVEQIDELNQRSPDRFTSDIKDWAHSIRVFGNWGVHPDKDGLKDVDKETAKEIIGFLKSYFHYVYLMPKKVASARSKQKPKP